MAALDAQAQQKLKNDLTVAKNSIEFLKSLLLSIEDPSVDDVKKNDVIQELVQKCRQMRQRFIKLIEMESVQATESIFSMVLQLNDDLSTALEDYETLSKGQKLNKTIPFDYNENNFKEKSDPFVELATRTKPAITVPIPAEDPFESLARRKKDEKSPTQPTQQNLDDFDMLARRNLPNAPNSPTTPTTQQKPKTQKNTIDDLLG